MSIEIEPVGAQGRWDETFQKIGRSCPAQRADEGHLDYLRRLSRIGRKYIPTGEEIAGVRFDHTLPDAVVGRFSELMRGAVERNIFRTDNMRPGEFKSVLRTDENTGQKIREFYGPQSFVKEMGQAPRLVVGLTHPDNISRLQAARDKTEAEAMANKRHGALIAAVLEKEKLPPGLSPPTRP
jgi:hypothetical protein